MRDPLEEEVTVFDPHHTTRPTTVRQRTIRPRTAAVVALVGATALVASACAPPPTAVDAAGTQAAEAAQAGARAKNVIFIQGDGMGIAHRELIRLATVGHDRDLAMNTLRYSGLVHTDPDDPKNPVTDSAAAATAYSTGVRTYNGAVGVDVDGVPVQTLLERARKQGKATGLVTTSQVTDATPAAFGSHVLDRGDQSEIARQYLVKTQPDVILGGGEDWWLPAGDPGAWPDNPKKDPTEQSKGTEGDLIAKAKSLGYDYVKNAGQLDRSPSSKLLGLFANEEMFEHRNEGQGAIYNPPVPLATMATKALDVLSRDRDGFFLLLEEEGIDEMAHHNNARLTIKAGQALEDTVVVAKRFAASHPGTLILVVGDHETGGLAIENIDDSDESGDGESTEDCGLKVAGTNQRFCVDWTTEGHTGGATPLTAEGPGAAGFDRVLDNTDVHEVIVDAMG